MAKSCSQTDQGREDIEGPAPGGEGLVQAGGPLGLWLLVDVLRTAGQVVNTLGTGQGVWISTTHWFLLSYFNLCFSE